MGGQLLAEVLAVGHGDVLGVLAQAGAGDAQLLDLGAHLVAAGAVAGEALVEVAHVLAVGVEVLLLR